MAVNVSQIELINAISRELHRQHRGVKGTPRLMNSIIEAANLIVDAFDRDDTPAVAGSGVTQWLQSDATGLSSLFMCYVLTGKGRGRQNNHPHDPSDLNRCIGLLDAAPELRSQIIKMKEHGPVWSALIDHWDELESLLREELPTGQAPKCYERMRAIIDSAS